MSQTYISAVLRRKVRKLSRGQCEYCLLPEALTFGRHQFDHIIAEKYGGETTIDNLAFSCTPCNRRKGSDIASIDPLSGEVVALFHPRRQSWSEHFQIDAGAIRGLTPSA